MNFLAFPNKSSSEPSFCGETNDRNFDLWNFIFQFTFLPCLNTKAIHIYTGELYTLFFYIQRSIITHTHTHTHTRERERERVIHVAFYLVKIQNLLSQHLESSLTLYTACYSIEWVYLNVHSQPL